MNVDRRLDVTRPACDLSHDAVVAKVDREVAYRHLMGPPGRNDDMKRVRKGAQVHRFGSVWADEIKDSREY